MHSPVHKLATRSMQQRCIPHTLASTFSRGVDRHTDVGKHVANVGVHSCLRIISTSPLLYHLPIFLSLLFSRSYATSHSGPCSPSLSRSPSYEGDPPSSFYSTPRPVIVDTTVQNGCFTPPLARELGNKLAAGLISLSRPDAGPSRLRRQGTDVPAFEPMPGHGFNRCPDARINGWSAPSTARLSVSFLPRVCLAGSANETSLENATVLIEMASDRTVLRCFRNGARPDLARERLSRDFCYSLVE